MAALRETDVERGRSHLGKPKQLIWGVRITLSALPLLLHFAFFCFGYALTVYLWDINVVIAQTLFFYEISIILSYLLLTFLAIRNIGADFFRIPPEVLNVFLR